MFTPCDQTLTNLRYCNQPMTNVPPFRCCNQPMTNFFPFLRSRVIQFRSIIFIIYFNVFCILFCLSRYILLLNKILYNIKKISHHTISNTHDHIRILKNGHIPPWPFIKLRYSSYVRIYLSPVYLSWNGINHRPHP